MRACVWFLGLYDRRMSGVIGYHIVKTTYGTWLPGDERGSWSEGWDDRLGYFGAHRLHDGDARRERMARARMKCEPVVLTAGMVRAVTGAVGACAERSSWEVGALAIEPTHMHLLITCSGLDVDRTARWIGQMTTKAVHRDTDHAGVVWSKGSWRGYVRDAKQWQSTAAYIERHNVRRGLAARPYGFIAADIAPGC